MGDADLNHRKTPLIGGVIHSLPPQSTTCFSEDLVDQGITPVPIFVINGISTESLNKAFTWLREFLFIFAKMAYSQKVAGLSTLTAL